MAARARNRISGFANLFEKIINGRYCVDCVRDEIVLAGAGYEFLVDDVRESRRWTKSQQTIIDFLREQSANRAGKFAV